MDEALSRVIEKAGGKKALADLCRVTIGAACQWRRVPLRHVGVISRALAIDAHDLRPDIYAPGSRAPIPDIEAAHSVPPSRQHASQEAA